ncbi:hypothetical protein SAMN05421832_103378 [Psychrobacillus psychrodurans]|nr:hypothetical protein SAMN05421832_103378 [Psychrobacillus psychrodurans]
MEPYLQCEHIEFVILNYKLEVNEEVENVY